jgi:hypothetical protein
MMPAMQEAVTSTDQGASNSASADQEVEVDDTSGEKEPDSEEMEEDDEYGGNSDSEDVDDDHSEVDEFAEFEWLEPMEGLVTCTVRSSDDDIEKRIGSSQGKLIRRDQIRTVSIARWSNHPERLHCSHLISSIAMADSKTK